jgi:hypothetical protein
MEEGGLAIANKPWQPPSTPRTCRSVRQGAFEVGLNCKIAQALAVRIPHTILLRAQSVID